MLKRKWKGTPYDQFPEAGRDLFEAIRNGDEEAYTAYYLGYADSMVKFMKKILYDEEEAREVTQDVFAYLWENRKNINPDKSLNSFIFNVAKNMSYNIMRRRNIKQKYVQLYTMNNPDLDFSTEEHFISEETSVLLNHILGKMPPQRSKVFELSRIEGKSYEEIAVELGISINTVKHHMKLALKDMRKILTCFAVLIIFSRFIS